MVLCLGDHEREAIFTTTPERKKDILDIIQNLDISPTLYQNAVEKYKHLTEFLEKNGYGVSMYPQGSFALGTVVRPIYKGDDAAYDLDFIYLVSSSKKDITPKELRDEVERILRSSDIYGKRLVVNDACFTLTFADINGVGFSIDIVPATKEDEFVKAQLLSKSAHPELLRDAIAIPKESDGQYCWLTNNPKGYKAWFDRINLPYAVYNREAVREAIYCQNSMLFSSVEEVPAELERSPVQRVIQILKYHRDIYYGRLQGGAEKKPISAIIGTLVAQIAETQSPTLDTFTLLDCVLKELFIYARQLTMKKDDFVSGYPNKTLLVKEGDVWVLPNPANPGDNLTDSWNQQPDIASAFFRWLQIAYTDLISSLELDDARFRNRVACAFGEKQVRRVWGNKYETVVPKAIAQESQARPWKS